ncbi:MAG: hypothetical protein J6K88_01845 [Oscillospiraceae bacterium]|nr:hypothetical protein [Oscillospiraceae bacterium]
MWEKLFLYDEMPEHDTVPALKLISFPFASDAWRPLCQLGCFSVKNEGLYFRFKPFEAVPKKGESGILSGSALSVSLGFPNKSDVLYISADGFGNIEFSTKEKKKITCPPSVEKINRGGDQQGDYFSLLIKIPFSLLSEIFSVSSLKEGDKILCNAFYTILENKSLYREHFAALFDNKKDQSPLEKLYDSENRSLITAVEFY